MIAVFIDVCLSMCRDDPKSMDCLVVSNCAKNGCEVLIEGDSIFSAVRWVHTSG